MGKDIETAKYKENAAFERCVDFMARMIEKYGHEITEFETENYNRKAS
ncbi:hypothetical protein HZF24_06445 [Sedimentibacter hydroxybenzoicus DSM 7310]|uniref:Uncharacterized protein n=1 Tax=Sedimentibacter hydroxybenzoicus DSM 7310 TaxID=1123245 RepID=A0A974GVV3_SEDHY|nr:hypothetical protein [Sedimentibacter hydroxybenzoicus]NYB73779.1 hypothetical protein [Sedimentibacter hydroxybenzoicus DSM 7310]